MKPCSLYFHIPFCKRKCDYCHFFVVPNQQRYHDPLLRALQQQWDLRKHYLEHASIVSLYFGGGTPSLLGPKVIEQILAWTNASKEWEITLEANPDHLTKAALQAFKAAGINRLSLGVQSFNEKELSLLSRQHSAKEAIEIIEDAHDCGFDNISIDLMYDLPFQTTDSWQQSLQQATRLPISHLSLYNLTIEPHTVFYKKRHLLPQPDSDTSLQLLNQAITALEQAGLKRYEISAFGRPSLHNVGYWTNRPFLGFGPSAFSDWDGCRFQNIANLWRFIHQLDRGIDPISFSETLPPLQREKERVAIGLRLFSGVQTNLCLKPLLNQGWVAKAKDTYFLTQTGRLFYDSVAEAIID